MLNKSVLWDLSYGVYIVSAVDKNRPVGCVANSIMQLTHDCVAISLNHQNYTNEVVKKNKKIAVSILPNEIDENLIPVFGFTSSREKDKFDNVRYKIVNGLPVIEQACSYIVLEVEKEVELETHTLFIARIIAGDVLNKKTPMTYKYYHEVIKGKAPKAAPTYIAEEVKAQGLKYKCSICGFVYDGNINRENEYYTCPVCRQPKRVFVKV